MKKIALLTLLLINLSLSFSLPRNQASPAIFSVTKTNNSILFRHTDSTLTAIPCQSVASIVSNADPSKIVSVWVVQQGDYDKIMQFDYLVCGFSSKSDAVDSLTAWAICDTSSGGGGGGDVTQEMLDDTSSALNGRIDAKQATLISGTNIKTINSTSLLGSGNIVTPDAQTLTAGTNTLTISGGNTVNLGRKLDTAYLGFGVTRDTLVLTCIINGVVCRYPLRDSTGGSSSVALSALTDATSIDSINNGNYRQAWTWNSLANNSGLKLSSTAPGTTSNQTNKLFESTLSGSLLNSSVLSYAGYFKNTQTTGAAVGLYVESPGQAIQATGYITSSNEFNIGGQANTSRWYNLGGSTFLKAGSDKGFVFCVGTPATYGFYNYNASSQYLSINNISSTRQNLIFTGDYNGGNFRAEGTSVALIERNTGKLIFSASTGESGSYANFTPKNIMTVQGSTTEALGNVGIGTTSPVASAKLELSSTTMGFLPPRMTSTQASAISSPAQGLMLFVTDTNGTFTAVGWWGYNGSTWEKLNN